MNLARRLVAGLLNLAVLSVLFVGSCAVPAVAYFQSPWWFLEDVGPEGADTFFVASRSGGPAGPLQLRVVKFDPSEAARPNVDYHLPDGRLDYSWGPGEGSATIHATTEGTGGQVVRVFVAGDTPWTSLSEYRVIGNKVHPLRHSRSATWLLLGIPVLLVVFERLRKPIARRIRNWSAGGSA